MPASNYTELMIETLLRAQEAQRSVLRAALAPGGDPGVVERILRSMEEYL